MPGQHDTGPAVGCQELVCQPIACFTPRFQGPAFGLPCWLVTWLPVSCCAVLCFRLGACCMQPYSSFPALSPSVGVMGVPLLCGRRSDVCLCGTRTLLVSLLLSGVLGPRVLWRGSIRGTGRPHVCVRGGYSCLWLSLLSSGAASL